MATSYADICFGCFLTFDEGEVDHDTVEEFEDNGANTSYGQGKGYTIWYGLKLCTISEASAVINDPRIFLHTKEQIEEMVDQLRATMGDVPVELRKKLSPPKFFLAWGEG